MKHISSSDKIKLREDLRNAIHDAQSRGLVVGFTSGVFDLLHAGHAQYLQDASSHCDVLVVGVNSDESTRALKGPKRPIVGEENRARMVAALGCVDYVFLFSEKNNNVNVEVLKPDMYLKAGDYRPGTLTSASIVEKHGGKVVIVPFVSGLSSSSLMEQIAVRYADELPVSGPAVCMSPAPAAFIDRDGTINEEVEYLHDPADFRLIPGAMEAIRRLNDAGYRIVIVTNQPGIGLGYYTSRDFFRVNSMLLKAAGKAGASIDRVYFCPHTKADGCDCRKPGTFFIERAARELNLLLEKSVVIGDMTGDIRMGKDAGIRTVLVRTGKAGTDGIFDAKPDLVAADLPAAVDLILGDALGPPEEGARSK